MKDTKKIYKNITKSELPKYKILETKFVKIEINIYGATTMMLYITYEVFL